MMNLKTVSISAMMMASLAAFAEEYVVIGKEAKVFDSPDATGYVTLNTKNEEVVLSPGMVFKIHNSENGWYVIEYSPGLRGYLSEQAKASKAAAPQAGNYSVSNTPSQQLNASGSADKWNANVGGKQFAGKSFGNAVVFFDDKGYPAYTLTDLGTGPIVMTYDNAVTKFF